MLIHGCFLLWHDALIAHESTSNNDLTSTKKTLNVFAPLRQLGAYKKGDIKKLFIRACAI